MLKNLRKNLRKLIYKFKTHDVWHMRYYSNDFDIKWYSSENTKGSKLQKPDLSLVYDHVTLDSSHLVKLPSLLNNVNSQQKRLSILASGPSIKSLDFQNLVNQDVALLNGSIKLLEKFPDGVSKIFHFVSDPNFIQNNINLFHTSDFKDVSFVFSVRAFYELWILFPEFILDNSARFHLFDQVQEPFKRARPSTTQLKSLTADDFFYDTSNEIGLSLNPRKGFFSGRTILFTCLQITSYWGYKDIEMNGADMQGSTRFYDVKDAKRAPSYIDDDFEKYILPSLKFFSNYCRNSSIKVVNRSERSRIPSEVFQKH